MNARLRIVAPVATRPVAPDPRIDALRARDRRTIEEVLGELLPKVRRWLHHLLGPRDDLDDAVQDALSEIASALPRYEGRASLATLARRITVRVAYRYFGKRRVGEVSLSLVPPPPESLDPESRILGREALLRLYRCLERLPRKRRMAFVLCAVEGMSPTEAAEIEGVSPLAMRSRLMHARNEVARRLASDPYVAALLRRGTTS